MIHSIRGRAFAWLAAGALLFLLGAGIATAQESPASREVVVQLRMPVGGSNIELAINHDGQRRLPSQRFATPEAAVDEPGAWAGSSSVALPGIEGGVRALVRISPAQGGTPARYEVGVDYNGEVLLPSRRYAAVGNRARFNGQWIESTSVTLPAATGGTNTGEDGDNQPAPPEEEDESDAPAFAFTSTPSDRTFDAGAQISPIVLPAATGGTGALRYDLIHRIRGLSFDRTSRTLSGTPQNPGNHLIFYTVSDSVGAVANATFTITVTGTAPSGGTPGADTRPTFGDEEITPQTWIVGETIAPMTLPEAEGGNAPIRYDLDPPIPGIAFDRSTRRVTGAPTRLGNFTMRYSATDADYDGASILFPVQIAAQMDTEPTLPLVSLSRDYVAGAEQSDVLPAGIGGNAPLTYSLTPDVPGLTFNPATRTLSGTPSSTGTYNMRYLVTDSDSDSYSANFSIRVVASTSTDLRPSFGGGILGDFLGLQVGRQSGFWVLTAKGGNEPLTYSLSGAPGFSARPSGGRISGTPTRAGTFRITLTVTDADGDSAVTTGRMFVSERSEETPPPAANTGGTRTDEGDGPDDGTGTDAGGTDTGAGTGTGTGPGSDEETEGTETDDGDLNPSFTSSPDNLTATVGVAMSVSLPAATGGNEPLEYAISAVPGLEFDSGTRTLSGTPTTAGNRELLYIVFDADRDIDARRFALNVAPASSRRVPAFSSSSLTCSGTAGLFLICNLPAATGGDGTLRYQITRTQVIAARFSHPRELSFDPGTRVLTAEPEIEGTSIFRYTAIDEDGDRAMMTVRVVTTPAPGEGDPAFAANTFAASTTASPGVHTLSETLPAASGGTGALTYSLETPPAGLSFNAADRTLSGSAEVGTEGTHRLLYTATDEDGTTATMTIELTIAAGADADRTPSFSPVTSHLCSGTAGKMLTCALPAAIGGDGTLAYTLATPPRGLRFTPSNRILSGRPAAAGRQTLDYTVEDADGDEAAISVVVAIAMAPPNREPAFSVTSYTCSGIAGTALSCTLPAASGGDGALTYWAETLQGLAFDASTRVLSGTPAAEYRNFIDYVATDSDGDIAELSVMLEIAAAPSDTPTFGSTRYSGFEGRVGEALTVSLPTASGGSGVLSYSLNRTFPGLAFNTATAVLSGTPSERFAGWVTLNVADAEDAGAFITFLVQIEASQLAGTPPPAAEGSPAFPARSFRVSTTEGPGLHGVSERLPAASGGNGALTYALAAPPQGLSFNAANRRLTGTAAAGTAGSYSLRYTAADEDGDTATMTIELTIAEGAAEDRSPSFAFSRNGHLCSGTAGSALRCTLPEATGGDGTLTYSLATPPEGLGFDAATRVLSGTPAAAGRRFLDYHAEDADGDEATVSITVAIAAADRTPSFAASTATCLGTAGTEFRCVLPEATGGDGALTYSLARQIPGLALDSSTRVLSGTPSAAGNHRITYLATDADRDSVQIDIIVRIAEATPTASDQSPSFSQSRSSCSGTAGRALSCTLPAASGGNGALTYSLETPPQGLGFTASTRVLSGTASASGTYNLRYTATDNDGDAATLTVTLIIAAASARPAFASENGGDIAGRVGQALSVNLATATGGTGALTYSTNWLPDGVVVDSSTAVMSGTPTATFRGRVQLTATDANGRRSSIWYTVIVTAAPDRTPSFAASTATCLGTAGAEFRCVLPEATGGDGTLTYSLARQIPGLALDSSTRVLSGTPSAAGNHRITYLATDADRDSVQIDIIVRIAEATPAAADRTPSFAASGGTCIGATGEAFSCTLPEATGGDGTLTYSLNRQIPGLAFSSSTRTLSGTPSAAGSHSLTYMATDADGDSVQIRIIIRITDESPSFSSSTYTCSGTAGEALRCTLPAASGGDGALTYSLATPPQGLSFASNRVLSGTVSASGSYSLTYTATDEDGDAGSMTVTVSIAAPANRKPAFAEQGTMVVRGTFGQALSATMREATGGDGALTYAMSGETVPGLVLNSATRVYSGTPTRAGNYILTFTVTDADGDRDYYNVNVLIAAAAPPPDRTPTFGTTSYSCEGTPGASFNCTLPAASGGDGTLTYSFGSISYGSGSTSPQDLSFSPSTRVLSGTAPTGGYLHTGVYTVTDADGDVATLTVDITGE